MAKFNLKCLNPLTNEAAEFFYDNETSELLNQKGESVAIFIDEKKYENVHALSIDNPANKTSPKTLKISLGLSCNYECSYCNQRFVPNADSTTLDDIKPFIDGLDSWVKEEPETIEFWGGEPLVYWKTLKPLAELLRQKYRKSKFIVITNGSLLDEEKNKWLDRLGFNVGFSHDGPGYHVRGLDPLDNPEQRAGIMDLWKRLGPQGRMSPNAMVHKDNKSRAAIQEFLVNVFGEGVPIGEGGFIDPYDEGGAASSLQSYAEQIDYRNNALVEMREGKTKNFSITHNKLTDFMDSIALRRPSSAIGQKCGMDRQDNIAVDLNGNVLTCQNVSAVSKSFNGESHKIGHVSDFENIKLNTSTHWSHREECPKCPVLQLCKGSCMFLEGPLWEAGCNNAFSDNIAFFASAIEVMTGGFLPFYIEGPQRKDRHDIFGLVHGVPEETKRKPFPIPVVAG